MGSNLAKHAGTIMQASLALKRRGCAYTTTRGRAPRVELLQKCEKAAAKAAI